jgi:hypothetical protein
LTVTAAEVLPVVCWSKEAAAARGAERKRRSMSNRIQLKFYLVDSRPEDAAREQGRFPTALSLGPDIVLDPERIKQNEDMFESLRGAVHIVIMGEGFSALPDLYNQKLSPKLQDLKEQDESRTNLCALFFVKKGFPFVSVLKGGFAAAHSWLVREGPDHHLNASAVLVDYDPERSLFGQLETLHNATATEKAQRKMANLLETSLVAVTRRAQQVERHISDLEKDSRQKFSFFGRADSRAQSVESKQDSDKTDESAHKKTSGFVNPFAGRAKKETDVSFESDDGGKYVPPASTEATPAMETSISEEVAPPPKPLPATLEERATTAPASFEMTTTPPRPTALPQRVSSTGASLSNNNPFKGLGDAFSNTMKSSPVAQRKVPEQQQEKPAAPVVVQSVLKRNPFARARFGGGLGASSHGPQEQPAAKPTGGGFGGFNQFRKNTMARMRGQTEGGTTPAQEAVSSDSSKPDQKKAQIKGV